MATHSSILAWDLAMGNPIDRGAWWGHKRVRDFLATKQQSFPLITMFVFYVCGLFLFYK